MALDLQIIPKSLADAVLDTFSTMANSAAEIRSINTDEVKLPQEMSIIAVLAVDSAEYAGNMALHFPSTTYIPLMNGMLGEKHDKICAENSDGVKELLNIIYASARNKINSEGFSFLPAIPTSLMGERLGLPFSHKGKPVTMQCHCTHGPFTVVVSLFKK